jgi:hypothetical protein
VIFSLRIPEVHTLRSLLSMCHRQRREVELATRDERQRTLFDVLHATGFGSSDLVGKKLATEGEVLPLVSRAKFSAVQLVGALRHSFEGELAQALAMF